MARSSSTPLLIVLLLLALAGAGLFVFLGRAGPETPALAAEPAGPAAAAADPEPEPPEAATRLATPVGLEPAEPGATTIAWPVKLALELVVSAHLPRAEGVPALGTNRTARLEGSVKDRRDDGVLGRVVFEAGPNAGRVLPMNDRGEFGASDLYPGLNIVKVEGPGIPGSLREVRLRTSKGEVLNVSYGLPGTMTGTVYGPDGEPLPDVTVECDAQRTHTDEQGVFFYPEMPGGTNIVLTLEKQGYARYFQVVGIGAGRQMSRDRYSFRMQPEAVLEVAVSSAVGGPGPTRVILLPANTMAGRDYPWWEVSPADIRPGTSLVIEGLPPTKIALRTFHPGALAQPADRRVNLRSGGRVLEEIQLVPAPEIHGIVRDPQGRAVPRARVALEAPDRQAATLFHLREVPYFMESEVVPTFPVAAQETTTDDYGRYVLSAWSEVAKGMYLTAESADGQLWAGRVLLPPDEPGADRELDLVVEPVSTRTGVLEIEFPGRVQGTPVEVTVNGEPIDPGVVPLEHPLTVEDLELGTWRLSGVWNGEQLFGGPGYQDIEVEDRARAVVHLPAGAIHGQDEDTLLRAGQRP